MGLNSPVATPAHGLLGLSLSLRLRFLYRRTQACLIFLCHHRRSHFTKLLTRALLFGPVTVHIFSFHVWPFALMLQVTWIKQYHSSRCSLDFVRLGFTQADLLESELLYAIKYFLKQLISD